MNDAFCGQGEYHYAGDEAVYVGEFLNGRKHGYGDHTFSTGDSYKGDFVNGVFDGVGEYQVCCSWFFGVCERERG